MVDKLIQFVSHCGIKDVEVFQLEHRQIVLEERVRFNCFFCRNYSNKWCCPPNIPDLDYSRVLQEYDNFLLLTYKYGFDGEITTEDRTLSTNIVHKLGLELEKFLWENNHPLAKVFIGGGCKLCGYTCPMDDCSKPTMRRLPLEAIGVNVVKTAGNIGIDIVFPPKNYFYRVGLLLW